MIGIVRKPLTGIGLILLMMLLGLALAQERVYASGELIIDDFVSGTATIGPACHSVGYASHSDPSILGGKRQIVVIDGHSCVTGNSPRASFNAGTGTAEWWGKSVGNSAVGQWIAYGTAIGNISKPWAVNPEIANNPQTPLDLSLTTADAILLDMAQVDPDTPFIRIELFAGNGQRFAAFFTIAAGVNTLPLSVFIGLTDAVAADIDGIEFSGQAGGTSVTLGNGHIFNKIAVTRAVVDTTPPVITPNITGTLGDNGWYVSDVNVSWTVTDGESTISSESGCGPSGVTSDTAGVTFTCTATSAGGTASASVTVKRDATPPTVTCAATPNKLWPPNHKMASVNVSVAVSDATSGSAGFTLVSATSTEPDNGLGDGDTPNDIQGFVVGTADTGGQVRAERSGNGSRRLYTLTYTAMDLAGNSASCSAIISVPHDQGK